MASAAAAAIAGCAAATSAGAAAGLPSAAAAGITLASPSRSPYTTYDVTPTPPIRAATTPAATTASQRDRRGRSSSEASDWS